MRSFLRVSAGACLIVGSVLWVPIWLYAAAWVGATADIRTWAVFCALLGVGILALVVGISLALGRWPSGRTRLAWGVAAAVPLAMFGFVFLDNGGAARINSAVSRDYTKQRGGSTAGAYTQCDHAGTSSSGLEWWICVVEPYQRDLDVCRADVNRRLGWRISVRLGTCRSDVDDRSAGRVDAAVERAYASSRRATAVHADCLRAAEGGVSPEPWVCRVSAVPLRADGGASMLDRHHDACAVEVEAGDDVDVSTTIASCSRNQA